MSDIERQRDKARIDRLIAALESEMGTGESDGDSSAGMDVLAVGSKAIVALLERRSKLLGLDAAPGSETGQGKPSTLTELEERSERRLASVPKAAGT